MRLLLSFLLFLSLAAHAQEPYPAKTVRLIAAAAPGGNPDVLARMLAAKLSDAFGRPFVVENVPGAGGVVAALAIQTVSPLAKSSTSETSREASPLETTTVHVPVATELRVNSARRGRTPEGTTARVEMDRPSLAVTTAPSAGTPTATSWGGREAFRGG